MSSKIEAIELRQSMRARARERVIQAGKAGEVARKRIEEVTLEAIDLMQDALSSSNPREQAEAARVILQAFGKLNPVHPTGSPLTREQRIAAIAEAMRNPDEDVAEAMKQLGIGGKANATE